ncbi:hypothetical protein [Virgibacillus sp. SK37]|uniref:hypothetical protein n=1 Tax=Virgibacillus sp. SK37 TaxID=403957 RepID=UPI0004D1D06B|nr:hypothetical protein [Virgibacillus sp. SK37]AIF45408.1 hypothetical protein X953_10015 [Virgibacillus sp. SK37]
MSIAKVREEMFNALEQEELDLSITIHNLLNNFSSGQEEQEATINLMYEYLTASIEMVSRYITLLEQKERVN